MPCGLLEPSPLTSGVALWLANISTLRSRGCCICWRWILAVMTLKTSGYKMENPFPTGTTIPVGHYIAQVPGITGKLCRQICSSKTSGHISWGDHIRPGPHFILLWEQRWLLTRSAESPLWRYHPKSEMPQQSNHRRPSCQESHHSSFCFPQSTFSSCISWECPLHHDCQEHPASLSLSTAQASLPGWIFMSFNCIKYLTPLTRMLIRLPKMLSLQKDRKQKWRLTPSNNFEEVQQEIPGSHVASSAFATVIFLLSPWRK